MNSKLFIIPLILLALTVVEVDNRNFLRHKLSDDELKGYHSCFAALIACAVIFVVLMFLNPDYKDKYEELQEQYDSISYDAEEYHELSSSVQGAYDDATTVKWYFLDPDIVSLEEAKESMQNLYDKLYPGEW